MQGTLKEPRVKESISSQSETRDNMEQPSMNAITLYKDPSSNLIKSKEELNQSTSTKLISPEKPTENGENIEKNEKGNQVI